MDRHGDPTGETVQVATATDAAYVPFVAAMAGSLAASRAAGTAVRLTVLHSGVDAEDRQRVADAAPGIEIRWLALDAAWYGDLDLPVDPLVLGPQYFRCLVPYLYPDPARRVVYLDADTIVLDDLAELWRTDLCGAPVGAVLDWLPTCAEAIGPWARLGLDPHAPYFNSGMLLMDLPAWRADEVGRRVLLRCLHDRADLMAQGRWQQHDQYGLNVVLHKRWRPLSSTWNYYSELPYRKVHVVHFVGNGKPGSPKCRPEYLAEFDRAMGRTAWSGWRPRVSAPVN
jgi:lipopolysaccharide biosynthesis glycosyltransferase